MSQGIYDCKIYFGYDYIYIFNHYISSTDIIKYSQYFSKAVLKIFSKYYQIQKTLQNQDLFKNVNSGVITKYVNVKRFGYLIKNEEKSLLNKKSESILESLNQNLKYNNIFIKQKNNLNLIKPNFHFLYKPITNNNQTQSTIKTSIKNYINNIQKTSNNNNP